jgi:hypothetical protein
MQLRSGRRDQDPAKNRPPTPQFIVPVARGPEMSKVRSITQLCGLRVTVETYLAQPYSELPWLCKVERSEGGDCKAGARPCLFWGRVASTNGRRHERQACRLELSVDHEKGKTFA